MLLTETFQVTKINKGIKDKFFSSYKHDQEFLEVVFNDYTNDYTFVVSLLDKHCKVIHQQRIGKKRKKTLYLNSRYLFPVDCLPSPNLQKHHSGKQDIGLCYGCYGSDNKTTVIKSLTTNRIKNTEVNEVTIRTMGDTLEDG